MCVYEIDSYLTRVRLNNVAGEGSKVVANILLYALVASEETFEQA